MHLHNKNVVVSPSEPAIIEALKSLGINTIFSDCVDNLIFYERYHADMQLLRIKDLLFAPQNACSLIDRLKDYTSEICICKSLGSSYPCNVSLNAALVGNKLFCKVDALAAQVREYCIRNGIKLVNVNQGYTKCSTLVVNENAIITADPTICAAAKQESVDVLLIKQGSIALDDNNYGFIGGASGVIGECVLFFGDLNTHPEADSIKAFLEKHKMKFISLCSGILKDVGGLVLLN